MKNRLISERIESVTNSYFWTAQFWKEILLRNIGPVQFLERVESEEFFWIAYYLIYLVKTLGPAQFWKEWSLTIFSENLLLHLLNTNTFLVNPDQNDFGKN